MVGEAEKGGPVGVQTVTAASLEAGSSPSPSISTQTLPKTDSQSTLTTWDGPDDPGNPRNWSLGARIYGVAIPTWYSFVVYVSSFAISATPCGDLIIMLTLHQNIRHVRVCGRYL